MVEDGYGGARMLFHDVETVLPGGLVPVLLEDDGPSGTVVPRAGLSLEK